MLTPINVERNCLVCGLTFESARRFTVEVMDAMRIGELSQHSADLRTRTGWSLRRVFGTSPRAGTSPPAFCDAASSDPATTAENRGGRSVGHTNKLTWAELTERVRDQFRAHNLKTY
ncbi:hypothetical protein GCM10023198_02530 [Promicromonospora umidemergens]|uniref:ROS/MUCR transcriptional regulator protein n=1 Tax=Promicromonospora umidemergens TaxID=629679 RepID=A0ABP8WEU1_9MICO